MKIVQLDIQGFRSLKNVSWRPGDLNVIIGPNGSGKSNLLRMLEMISAAAQGRLSRYVQDEGGIGAILWDGETDTINTYLHILLPEDVAEAQVNYGFELQRQGKSSAYQVAKELLEAGRGGPEYLISFADHGSVTQEGQKLVVSKDGHEKETLLSIVSGPLSSSKIINSLQNQFETWTIYQDIRTDQHAAIRQAPVSRLEQRVAPDGQNLINVLHTLYSKDRQFKQDINDAMFAAFGEEFDELVFPPDAGDQRVQMRVRWKTLKRDQSTAELSDGTLCFLLLITILANPYRPPLIAIDEPETGLHPSMLPIIADFAVEASRHTQVIFTTHSDSFLDAFQKIRPTTTIAKWADGETTLTTLDDTRLAYWLEDYSLGKLFRSGELENLAE